MGFPASFDFLVLVACIAILYFAYRLLTIWIYNMNEPVRDGEILGTPLTEREVRKFAVVGVSFFFALPMLVLLFFYWNLRTGGADAVFSTFLRAADLATTVIAFCAIVFWLTTKLSLKIFNRVFFMWFEERLPRRKSTSGDQVIVDTGPRLPELVVFMILWVVLYSGIFYLLTSPAAQSLLYGSYDTEIRGISEIFVHVYRTTESWGINQVVAQITAVIVTLAPIVGTIAAVVSIIKNSLDILDRTRIRETNSGGKAIRPNGDEE